MNLVKRIRKRQVDGKYTFLKTFMLFIKWLEVQALNVSLNCFARHCYDKSILNFSLIVEVWRSGTAKPINRRISSFWITKAAWPAWKLQFMISTLHLIVIFSVIIAIYDAISMTGFIISKNGCKICILRQTQNTAAFVLSIFAIASSQKIK